METKVDQFRNAHSGNENSRRNFFGQLAATASVAGLANPLFAEPVSDSGTYPLEDADAWFNNVKGKHRIVYDATEPHNGFATIWSWAFYLTNNQTGTPDKDMTAMVVLRHNAIPYAMSDALWEKYKFGEVFNIKDNSTGAPAVRNPIYIPKEGEFPIPEIEGIKKLIERGAMFCVCNLAIGLMSRGVAQELGKDPAEVKKDWIAGILPNIQLVRSGVWALGRAQENKCGYIYAGG